MVKNEPPAFLKELAAADAGKGVSPRVEDRNFWATHDPDTDAMVRALEAAEADGDVRPLIELLRSDRPLTQAARDYLADLLERRQLKRRRGAQQTPAYDRTAIQGRLELAAAAFKDLSPPPQGPHARDAAIETVAECWSIEPETLRAHLDGKREQSRVVKRRQPKDTRS